MIIFDDFKNNTADVYQSVLKHLDIDDSFETTFDVVNPNKEVRVEWLQKAILSTGFSLMLLKDRLTYLASTSRILPYSYRTQTVKGVIHAYTRYEKRSPLTQEVRQRILKTFESEIDNLSTLLNRDLSKWYQP